MELSCVAKRIKDSLFAHPFIVGDIAKRLIIPT